MNRQWMREQLVTYLGLIDDVMNRGEVPSDHPGRRELEAKTWSELRKRKPTIKRILKLLPDGDEIANFGLDGFAGPHEALAAVQQGLGTVEGMDAWAENLEPDAPVLPADQFHPWVWEPARTFWESQHYRAAVDAASRAINSHTQSKAGRRDISDTDLMNQVLAPPNPRSGQKFLRIPGDPNDRTVGNRNRALRPFAEGCFAGIRALAAHEHGQDWDEQRALESMAALSVLARWIDECEVRVHVEAE